MRKTALTKALPDQPEQPELFGSPNVTNLPIKDDDVSMSYPIFALRADTGKRVINAAHGKKIIVIPSGSGAATVRDKDLLLYINSQIMHRLNACREEGGPSAVTDDLFLTPEEQLNRNIDSVKRVNSVQRTFAVDAHRFLSETKRGNGRKSYENIIGMLNRLQGTQIQTDIARGGLQYLESFNIIERFQVVSSAKRTITVKDAKSHHAVEEEITRPHIFTVTLSEWFYNGLLNFEVLTLDDSYYKISKDIDRRMYELARKHCGRQPMFKINIKDLAARVGTNANNIYKFRAEVMRIIREETLINYRVALDRSKPIDDVVFYTSDSAKLSKELLNRGPAHITWFESLIRHENVDRVAPPPRGRKAKALKETE